MDRKYFSNIGKKFRKRKIDSITRRCYSLCQFKIVTCFSVVKNIQHGVLLTTNPSSNWRQSDKNNIFALSCNSFPEKNNNQQEKKICVSSMIHSTTPTIPSVAITILMGKLFYFARFWKVGDEWNGRTPRVKIVITTDHDCGSASWINKRKLVWLLFAPATREG